MYQNYPKFDKEEVLEYLRKSRTDDPLLSVEEVLKRHEEILDEYAEKYLGGKVPEKNVYREIKSSETIDDRPEMLQILKAIESPKIKAVLVVEVQRLSRGDLEDAGRIIKLFRYTNTYVITPQKIYDLRNEYDRDAFERELKRGNEYLEYTKKILNRGKLQAVKEGNFIATYPPYGYRKVRYKEGKRSCSTLEIIPSEAEIVKLVFNLYVDKNIGFGSIANYLNDLHIPAPKGDIWKKATIQDMISNVAYIGKVRWNYRKTIRTIEDQEVVKITPRNKIDDYLIFEGKHKDIISEELFNKAQERRGKNVPIANSKKMSNPLAGIFFCKRCGHAMKLRTGNDKNPPRFECSEMKYCKCGSVQYDDLMERIYGTLEACIEDFEIKLKDDNSDEVERHQKLIETLERKYKDLENKELRQWENYTEGDMPEVVFKKLNTKVLEDKEHIKEALCQATNSAPVKIDYSERVISFKSALNSLRDENVPVELKNRYLRQIIERMDYDREKAIRPTNEQAKELGVVRTHRCYWYNFPFELNITLR